MLALLDVPPNSQSLAVKEFYFTASRICRQFFVKFLAPTFPGNRRLKIGENFRHFFAAFFVHLGEKFRQNFALGAFRHNLLDGQNRQSLAFSERGQLSQATPQFHVERMLNE